MLQAMDIITNNLIHQREKLNYYEAIFNLYLYYRLTDLSYAIINTMSKNKYKQCSQ